jgi:hypothetical protein
LKPSMRFWDIWQKSIRYYAGIFSSEHGNDFISLVISILK